MMRLHDLPFDIRLAIRGLTRDRGVALTAIATLAVAIALNVTVFTIRDAMLFRGLPLARQSDRLLYIGMRQPADLPCCPSPVSYADFERWRSEARSFEGLAFGRRNENVLLRDGDGRPLDLPLTRRSANSFALLGVQPMLGRDFVAADEVPGAPLVAIISHRFWERRFNKRADIIGTAVQINGAPASIVGVLPEHFELVYEQELFAPLTTKDGAGEVIGRLRDGASVAEARVELDTITRQLEAADPSNKRGVPILANYTQAHVAPDAPVIYGTLWAGAWFVLLIACANLANLMMVRTVGRRQEFSTRLALGAGTPRIVRQLLIEQLVVAAVAAPIAWSLTKWSVGAWADATASQYLALDYSVTTGTLIYLLSISIGAAVLIACLPIRRVIRHGAAGVLKGDARGATHGARSQRFTAALVAFQMALAMVLLLGAGILIRSFANIVGADIGVAGDDRITVGSVRLPSDRYPTAAARAEFFRRLATQLKSLPSAEAVSLASTTPARSVNPRQVEIDGRLTAGDAGESLQVLTVDPDYFRVVANATVRGRDFTESDDAASPRVVLVNQSLVDAFWPGQDALGKRLRMIDRGVRGPWRTIVGVTPNVMQGDATRQQFKPVVYVPLQQQLSVRVFVFVRSAAAPAEMGQAIRAEIQRLDSNVLTQDFASLKTMTGFDRDSMDLEHADLAKHAAIAPVFAGVALVLAALGLAAVIGHSVGQRTREIGVRMAIGAAARDIARMVMREGMRPVAVGLLAGLVAASGANRILQSQLVGVSPYDPLTMTAAPLLLMAVAVIGCHVPARRASRIDPAVALRHE